MILLNLQEYCLSSYISLKYCSVSVSFLVCSRPDGFNPLSQLGLTSGGFVYCEASWEFIRVAYHVGSADSIYTFRIYPRHEPFDLHSKTILLSTFGDIPFGRTDSNDRKTINFAETEADKKTKNNDSLLMSDHPSEGINHKHSDKAYQILNDSLMWSNIRNDMFRGYRFELEMGENLELIIEPETSEIELANGTDRTHMTDDVMLLELEIDQTTDRNVNDSCLSAEFTIDDRSKNETSKVNTSIKSSSVGSPLAFNGSRIRTPIDEAPTTAEVITGHPTIEGASSTDDPLILDDGSHEIKESITNPLELLIETEPDITLSLVVDPIDEQPSDTGKVDSPDEILLQVETDAVNQLVTEGVSSSDHFSNIDANVSLEPPDDTHSLARFTPVNEDIHSRSNAKIETGVDVPRRHMLNLENTEDAIRSDKKNVEFPTIETLPDLMLEIV
ncbi:hypothetical protein AB6A40_005441 [Gnathostoma spinigerum]|uniref:Uncharacterized protein n=1 Tax=Gnathostoma spinigerum TaxID=75299 RepID=A0ABD6EHN7_9BILA